MIKGSTIRRADWPVDPLFVDRWSPRSMSGEPITREQLMPLLEAARWAPSSGNFQPWRMLYALRDTPHWDTFFALVNEGNRVWGRQAGAIVLFISMMEREPGKPSVTHSYDTGAAWQNFALQAFRNDLAAHGIQGFDYARARVVLKIPDLYRLEAMALVGHPAEKSTLPENLQLRERPSDRRPLAQTACEGLFSL
jgi:nitroreductase